VSNGQPYLQSILLTVTNMVPGGGINLSRLPGTVASASSEYSAGYAAALAIDGISSTSSSWCSDGSDTEPRLTVTFPSNVTIQGVAISNPWGASYAALTGRFVVYNASDTAIFDSGVLSLSSTGEISQVFALPVPSARRIDFLTLSTSSYPCLGEFAVGGSNP
jgi:hypothetical protein